MTEQEPHVRPASQRLALDQDTLAVNAAPQLIGDVPKAVSVMNLS
jgi:hypothetical protein